ncbi:MAG: hypothetical protein ACTHVH_10420 [Microbacterium gubbeenense]|nr:hypothetical protein [Microbacterium gubbeenense]
MPNPDVYAAAERWIAPQIKEWSPAWREHLAGWLDPSIELVGDAAWGAQYRDMVQLPVPDPLAWANRRIPLADGRWAIAGIRFRGQDIEKPFVDIIATSLAPDSAGVAALGEVLPHFSDFAPLCLRVNLPDPDQALRALAASDAVHATPDLLIVARPVAEMLELPLDDRYDDVTIAPCDPAFAAERVAAIYEELTPSRPKLAQWATPADADSLEDAAEQGLLFDVRVDAASAGIVAAERDDSYGLAGFCMQEVAIDHAHRGQRVGVAALQRLARELPSNADDVLWGHIHPDNVPSLRNAQESGRKVVTAHVWVTPAGYGGMPS